MIFLTKRCIICGKPAIVNIKYAHAAFCSEHFKKYYERRILRTLKDAKFPGGKILVALSGGVDSVALLTALTEICDELKSEIEAVHINLGIYQNNFSSESMRISNEVAKMLNVKLHIIDLKQEIGYYIPEIISKTSRNACSICGLIRRYLLNKFAFEKGFDWLATGHNLDDVAAFYLKALASQTIESIMRGLDVLTPPYHEFKLVGRIRPQLYITKMENRAYVALKKAPIVEIDCPLGKKARLHKYVKAWKFLVNINPVSQLNFVKSINILRSKLVKSNVNLKRCKICGYPTTATDSICAFCRLINKIRNIVH